MCDGCSGGCNSSKKKLPLITSAFLVLTESCNLKCRYCWVNQNSKEMTLETAKHAVDFLLSNSEVEGVVPNITFFGGEPLLKWEQIIVPLVKYIREEKNTPFRLNITSNCVLITEEKMKFLKKYDVTLLFSIDGDKESQDFNRPFHNGEGSFDRLSENISLIPKYFPQVTFRSTITPETAKYLFHNLKFTLKNGYAHMFATPNVFTEWDEGSRLILKEEVRKISDYYMENLRQGILIKYINIEELIHDAITINRIIQGRSKKPLSKCGIGEGMGCSITPNGTMLGCQEMSSYDDDTFVIGDIFNGADDGKRYHLSESFKYKNIEGTNCNTCKYRPICNGGCVANNYLINKNLNKMPEMSCYWNQLLLEEALRIIKIMGTEKNQLFKQKYFLGSV